MYDSYVLPLIEFQYKTLSSHYIFTRNCKGLKRYHANPSQLLNLSSPNFVSSFLAEKKVKNEDPGIYFKYLDCECVNVRSHVCGCDQLKIGPHARTSHTCFRVHFARTHTCATAHHTCACAHAPSQLIP